MSYQIDQSIKIENTNKTSYVCLSNGKIIVVSIPASDKKELKLFFRKLNKPLIFKLFTFSVLCAKAIITIKPGELTIDTEYVGHDRQIKSFILQILRIENLKEDNEPIMIFNQVGKSSNAHKGAYTALKNQSSNIKVTSSEILQYYEKINKK